MRADWRASVGPEAALGVSPRFGDWAGIEQNGRQLAGWPAGEEEAPAGFAAPPKILIPEQKDQSMFSLPAWAQDPLGHPGTIPLRQGGAASQC
ncbi:hypothetical protein CHELA1G11_21767 [Hyphomicrobiales bacterium]|nr:hypothetical protein CHELA1G2_20032 [Hyphomicrobiales bacterium]CAH1695089.1 hypothetical protein CHELA1G11_21767 [Hyphomicrobiales bacterium]